MLDFMQFFANGSFIPHGHCYLWQPGLVWLHVTADALIALAYYSIPLTLFYFVRKRSDLPFDWIFLLFGSFIIACGTTHVLEIWTLWHPTYWLSGSVKALTAFVSCYTAVQLVPLVPKALALQSPEQLEVANQELAREIRERQRTEAALRGSEAELRALFAAMTDVVLVRDHQGRCLKIAPTNPQNLYKPRDEMMGKTLHEVLPRSQADAILATIQHTLETQQITQSEYSLAIDGREVHFSTTCSPLSTDSVLLVGRDVTQFKQAEKTLELQSVVVKNMAGGVCLINAANGLIVYTNPKFERMFGYDAGELNGKHPSNVNYEDLDGQIAEAIMRDIREQGEATYEVHNVKKDGTPFWCQATASVFEHPEHGTVLVAVQHDITERKQAAIALQKKTQALRSLTVRLEQSNRELQDFAFVASHDLKEPLRTIRSFSSLLQAKCKESLNEAGRDYLDRIQTATQRMTALIDDLLSLSQVTIEAKPFAAVKLADVAQAVVAGLETQIRRTGGHVEIGDLPTVQADSTQLAQLFQNLISNALKFHREEPPIVRIYCCADIGQWDNTIDRPCYAIAVEDNGIGFEQRYVDRIFQPFERLHGRDVYEGTGIGLTICRRIAERHGGHISARSTLTQGSTFIITLPVTQTS